MSVAQNSPPPVSEEAWRAACDAALASLNPSHLPDDLQIPSLPAALSDFLQASSGDDYDVRELGRIIERDPGLTVDLLKFVNSAAHASRTSVRTPTDALVRLGVPTGRKYLMAAGIRSATLAHESKLMNPRNFWNESLRRGLFSRFISEKLGEDPDLGFLGGLLQDFLLPVLTNQHDTEYISYLRDAAPQGVTLVDWERATFGWDHAGAAAFVAHQWNLSDDLVTGILLHHSIDMYLQTAGRDLFRLFPIAMAGLLPDQLSQSPGGVERLLDADSNSSFFNLDDACHVVDEELRELSDGQDAPLCLEPIFRQAREGLATEADQD